MSVIGNHLSLRHHTLGVTDVMMARVLARRLVIPSNSSEHITCRSSAAARERSYRQASCITDFHPLQRLGNYEGPRSRGTLVTASASAFHTTLEKRPVT